MIKGKINIEVNKLKNNIKDCKHFNGNDMKTVVDNKKVVSL